jgi:hypothetical protein
MSDTRTSQVVRQVPRRNLKDALANAERVQAQSEEALRRAYELIAESRRARAEQQKP